MYVHCPICGDRVAVPMVLAYVRVYSRNTLEVKWHESTVEHQCVKPDPTQDRRPS